LVCAKRGQNAARNYGLKAVQGELIVLADDDILPEARWLQEMYQGTERWPEQVQFGGRVLPKWLGTPPDFEVEPGVRRWLFGACDPGLPEGPDAEFLPLSANMAIRRRVFDDKLTFDESIGPNGLHYASGSETAFSLHLRSLGYHAVFLPRSLTYHMIRPHQMEREWLLHRAFRQGRGEARFQAPISWYETARLMKHALWATAAYYRERLRASRTAAFRKRMSCALTRGRLYEACRLKLGLS
jgi:GT2 family glycosyltransferase